MNVGGDFSNSKNLTRNGKIRKITDYFERLISPNLIKFLIFWLINSNIQKVGLEPFQVAVEASKTLNGAGDMADSFGDKLFGR